MSLTLAELEAATSEQLLRLIERRHPDYAGKREHWDFLDLSYRGGREWIESNIFTYHKEGKHEFAKRKERAYRFPHSREVVSLVNKYVFKGAIDRSADAPSQIKEFWGSATLLKRPIEDLMSTASSLSSTFGRVWVVVDNNLPEDVRSEADRKKSKGRCYSYILKPAQVYDFEYDEDGELEWFMNGEFARDKSSPLTSTGSMSERFRVWTKDATAVIELVQANGTKSARLLTTLSRQHDLGIVPVFPADHITSEELYSAAGLLEDVAYLDRAVANYLSNLDVIIQDQTFSQLAIPFQGLLPTGSNSTGFADDDEPDELAQLISMGTKRVFAYNAEGGSPPTFISPDVKQAAIIMQAVTKIVGEIYHSIGMAGERTKEDNSAGIDNSSGVAKAYDFEKLNAMLASKARSLQNIERNMVRLVNAWNGEVKELEQTDAFVSYPTTFDVRNLADEMDNAQRLAVMVGPKELRRVQMKRLNKKMFPQMSEVDVKKIEDEIDNDWLEIDPAMLAPNGGAPTGAPPTNTVPGKKNAQGENNKGSVKAKDQPKPGAN